MPAPLILTFVSTVAFAVQLLIFAYLYSSHRVRFFQYLLLAWGAYTLSKGLKLVDVLVLGVDHPSFVTDLTTVAAVGFTLAAAFAHRWGYRFSARDVLLGSVHRIATQFVSTIPGSTGYLVVHAVFILLYFLSTFAVIIMVLERARSDSERLHARLREAERLATAGELAAGMAHEIRNPLAAIVNATALLDDTTLTAEERAGTLAAVRTEARRLNRILSDFLKFTRPRRADV